MKTIEMLGKPVKLSLLEWKNLPWPNEAANSSGCWIRPTNGDKFHQLAHQQNEVLKVFLFLTFVLAFALRSVSDCGFVVLLQNPKLIKKQKTKLYPTQYAPLVLDPMALKLPLGGSNHCSWQGLKQWRMSLSVEDQLKSDWLREEGEPARHPVARQNWVPLSVWLQGEVTPLTLMMFQQTSISSDTSALIYCLCCWWGGDEPADCNNYSIVVLWASAAIQLVVAPHWGRQFYIQQHRG